MKRRILIIGGLAAGPSAASKAKRTDPEAEVLIFEQGEYISYGVCEIPYLLSGEIADNAAMVVYSPERLKSEKGVTANIFHQVDEIVASKKEIRVRDLNGGVMRTEAYDKLIIATGSLPKRLGLEGEKCRNVFTIKALDEAYAVRRFIEEEKPRRAVIIGAGFIGMEMSDALVRRGIDVTILHNGKFPMGNLEEGTRLMVADELGAHGVNFVPGVKAEWLGVGGRGNVVAVGTADRTFETDMVVVAIGVAPNSTLAKDAGVHIGNYGGIAVDDRMRALGAESVYAAGDCCELRNIVTKKPMVLSLATLASKTGWVAGENAAGGSALFKGAIRAIGVRIFDKEVAHVGLSSAEAKGAMFDVAVHTIDVHSKAGMMPHASKIRITLIADRKSQKLLGANVIGEMGAILRANTLAVAIRHGLTIDEVAQFDLIYTPPYAPLWDGILTSAQQMKKHW